MASRFFVVNLPNENPRRNQRRSNVLELDDDELIKEYRMTKCQILVLCELLKHDLPPSQERSMNLTVEEKVLISLKTLASGSFQNSAKDNINVSQSTVSRVPGAFADEMVIKAHLFISMPCSENKQRLVKSAIQSTIIL